MIHFCIGGIYEQNWYDWHQKWSIGYSISWYAWCSIHEVVTHESSRWPAWLAVDDSSWVTTTRTDSPLEEKTPTRKEKFGAIKVSTRKANYDDTKNKPQHEEQITTTQILKYSDSKWISTRTKDPDDSKHYIEFCPQCDAIDSGPNPKVLKSCSNIVFPILTLKK